MNIKPKTKMYWVLALVFSLFLLGDSTRVTAQTWNNPDGNGHMTNANSGNVGIGITPATRFHIKLGSAYDSLTIEESQYGRQFRIVAPSATTGATLFRNTFTGADFVWERNPAGDGSTFVEDMRLSGGKLGIGTYVPGFKLTVQQDSTTSQQLAIQNDNTSAGRYSEVLFRHSNGAGPSGIRGYAVNLNSNHESQLRFFTSPNTNSPTERMTIDQNGNVGVGTTSPPAQLSINQEADIQATLRLSNNGISSRQINIKSAASGFNGSIVQSNTGADFEIGNVSGALSFMTNNTNRFYVTNGGNVGIGKADPGYKLDVNGTINSNSTITANNFVAKYQDVAEWVPASEQLSAGTVVVLDSTKSNQVTSSSVSYDTRVAGVVSEQPGIALGEKSDGKVLVSTTGGVRVKVDATKGPIHIGDLLVTSDILGVAMKSEAVNLGGVQIHRPGTLIGKALEPLDKGKGEILVLLSLQ